MARYLYIVMVISRETTENARQSKKYIGKRQSAREMVFCSLTRLESIFELMIAVYQISRKKKPLMKKCMRCGGKNPV